MQVFFMLFYQYHPNVVYGSRHKQRQMIVKYDLNVQLALNVFF